MLIDFGEQPVFQFAVLAKADPIGVVARTKFLLCVVGMPDLQVRHLSRLKAAKQTHRCDNGHAKRKNPK